MKKLIYNNDDIKRWITQVTPTLIYAEIPSEYEAYWKVIHTKSRANYRKAERNGFYVKRVDEPPHEDIVTIWNSFTHKQGRPINKRYCDIKLDWYDIVDKWPVDDYSQFDPNNEAHMCFYGCYNKKGICKGFLETITYNGVAAVHGTMGNPDSYRFGVMKYLFLKVIEEAIERDGLKRFYYGDPDFLQDDRRHFMREMLITEYR
jgi:hypothetical protein